jgi:DNA-binding MarR family transcriptional regulator
MTPNNSEYERFSYGGWMSSSGRARPSAASGQLAFLVAQIGGLAAMRFAERVEGAGVTPPQAGLLRVVAAGPGRTQQAVAGQLGLLPSRLVILIDELEGRGLLERRRDPHDRRNSALYVTDAGKATLQDIGRAAQAHGEDFLAPLTKADRATLSELLGRLAAHHDLASDVHPGYRRLGRES